LGSQTGFKQLEALYRPADTLPDQTRNRKIADRIGKASVCHYQSGTAVVENVSSLVFR